MDVLLDVLHYAYSSDLALCDFHVFGPFKETWEKVQYRQRDERGYTLVVM